MPKGCRRGPSPWKITLRYARYLAWEFRWPLGVFWFLVLAGGLYLHLFYHGQPLSYMEACYSVFMLIFLESYLPFANEWYLWPVFFLLPIIGLGAVADSLVRLAYLTFSQKQKLPEWQRMVASLHRNHTVVVGVGKVGFQIIQELRTLREPVVAVERAGTEFPLLDEIQDLGVPLVRGDARNPKTLEHAGVRAARAVIVATSDDLTNLDSGLTARDLNPDARIVLRLFDESLAVKVRGAFAMPVISTAHVSAPAFVAAATGRNVYQDFRLAGRSLHLIDLTIRPNGALVGKTVGEVQTALEVNIVMYHGKSGVNINPSHDQVLGPNDEVLVIAPIERLIEIEALNWDGAARNRTRRSGPPA